MHNDTPRPSECSIYPQSDDPDEPRVPLEAVIASEELHQRRSRPADFAAENRALVSLMRAMASSADQVLQKLVDTALELCNAHSTGISILEEENGHEVFRWRAIAGAWSQYAGNTMPRATSPCGTVLDRKCPVLFLRPDRHYPIPPGFGPLVIEALLIPFRVAGTVVGTLWVVSHDEQRKFDSEDLRLLTNLGEFAAAAYQLLAAQKSTVTELAAMLRLHQLTTQLTARGELSDLLHEVLDAIIKLQGASSSDIRLYDRDRHSLELVAHRGLDSPHRVHSLKVDEHSDSLYALAFRTRRKISVEDVSTDPRRLVDRDQAAAGNYRAVQALPLIDRAGGIVGVLSTHFREPHRLSVHDERMTELYARQASDAIAAKLAEELLWESRQRLQFALDSARMGTWTWDSERDRLQFDARALEMLGEKNNDISSAQTFVQRVHTEDLQRFGSAIAAAVHQKGIGQSEVEFRWLRSDKSQIWLLGSGQIHLTHHYGEARTVRMTGTLLDITQRKLAEERQSLLTREIDHRARNILSTIQAVISLTAHSHTDIVEFIAALRSRIRSIAKVHRLITDERWHGAGLRGLFYAELAPYISANPKAAELKGEDIVLTPTAAMSLTMVIHELTTNAAKYGSLSTPEGRVSLSWRRDKQRDLRLEWVEMGGPPVNFPTRSGFGSELIARSIQGELSGYSEISFKRDGLVCRMTIPAKQIVATPRMEAKPETPTVSSNEHSHALLCRPRILVVEEEPQIASHMANMLASLGFEVIGPATTVDEAQRLAMSEELTAAVFDANLGSTADPALEVLASRKIPFLFTTAREGRRPSDGSSAAAGKPLNITALKQSLEAIRRQH